MVGIVEAHIHGIGHALLPAIALGVGQEREKCCEQERNEQVLHGTKKSARRGAGADVRVDGTAQERSRWRRANSSWRFACSKRLV